MNFQLILLVLLPFSLGQSTTIADTDPESITAQPLFASQKPCAQQCFFPNYFACPVDAVASAIGCQYGQNCPPSVKTAGYEAANNCYCRTDLQPVASRYLLSCVLQKCTVGDSSIDVSSALGLYDTYYWNKGFVPATATAAAGKSGQGTFTTSSPTSPTTQSNTQSTDSNTNTNTNTQSGFSTSDRVALGCGVGIGLPATLATLYMCFFK